MDKLNNLELAILEKLSIKYPAIKSHIPLLAVKDRIVTGVGMYVNFCYNSPLNLVEKLNMANASISTNDNIKLKKLQFGLGYEVDISEGMILFIEFITYGETWDGEIRDFTIVTK